VSDVDSLYRDETQIVNDVLAAWQSRIPDIGVSPGSIVRIWAEVFANSATGFLLSLQLMHDDIFIQTMSTLALQRAGEEFGRDQKPGTLATGTVTLAGAGGTFIGSGGQVGAPQVALGTTLVFETTEDVTIPDPGVPTAPTATDAASSGNVDGTVEYGATFTTAKGETVIGAASIALTVSHSRVNLTDVPLGGAGTLARKLYRRKNGGDWQYLHTLADNSTTAYADNIADGGLGGAPPVESTAEQVDATAQATDVGIDYNVGIGAISVLVDVGGDVTGVTNSAMFTGGEDSEATEAFRQSLLHWVQSPQSGSADDLVNWASSIDGVSSAAVFKNVNLAGTPELGSVVVRIAGVGGAIPDGDTVAAVLAYLESKDLANITIYVGTFDALNVDVTVDIVLDSDYVLGDVAPSVEAAIADYVDSVPVGGTVYVAGLVHIIFALPGVVTVEVDLPADDVVASDGEKPVVGTVIVNEWTWWS
jgi:uncharacterized phage protein gp47/JayE